MAKTETKKSAPKPTAKTSEMKVKEIINQDVGLSIIMNQKLPVSPSWKFGQWKESTERTTKAAGKKREEIITSLGQKRPDGQIEVLPKNKESYFEQYRTLENEMSSVTIPEIATSSIKDVLLSVRFTTLIGQYLKNDAFPINKEKFDELTNQTLIDLDLACSIILNEQLPAGLALKLGEVKRTCEFTSAEYKELREGLIKKLGTLNKEFEWEIADEKKKDELNKKASEFLEAVAKPVELPTFEISEFEINVNDKMLELPSRFFTLFTPLMTKD